jgi:hypothetical protein
MVDTGASDPGRGFGDTEGTVVHAARVPSRSCDSTMGVEGWADALAHLHHKRARHPDLAAVGVIVYRASASGGSARVSVRFVREAAREPLALVVGRHPQCDVSGLQHASLRHALVLCWPRASRGRHPLEVLDLRSGTGLVLSRGQRVGRISSPGPVRFGVGSDEVTLLHASAGARFPVDFPDDLDGWAELEERVAMGMTRPVHEPGFEDTNASVVVRFGGGYRRLIDGARVDLAGCLVVQTTEEELRRGLLLGRYARCDSSAHLARDEHISRVHALAIVRGGKMYVVDVGSSNGTRVLTADGEVLRKLQYRDRVHRLGAWEGLRLGRSRVAFELSAVH